MNHKSNVRDHQKKQRTCIELFETKTSENIASSYLEFRLRKMWVDFPRNGLPLLLKILFHRFENRSLRHRGLELDLFGLRDSTMDGDSQ